ncbi:hypothetical protein [Glycomyces sp. NRRL B-16210]|uniref:hypothetical protein n=1 Tax=Glycomyces sp. NRRL B-16210 TaxID=1463821 RepID=UPI0004BFD003|nr:hypothetical protein [Glycomyces sp. NRRL B-16210]
MSENTPGERSLTSACGRVTVTVTLGAPPKVELSPGAERMFSQDLADLVTHTAIAATDAALAEAPEPAAAPSIEDSIAELTGLRDDLQQHDLATALERRRSAFSPAEDRPAPQEGFTGPTKLELHPAVMETIEASIKLLERFNTAPPGGGGKDEVEPPVGKATNEARTVTIESTLDQPIVSVWLSKRASEIGPKALGVELTETAAAAAADLAGKQNGYFTDLGIPLGPDDIGLIADENRARGDQAIEDIEHIDRQREELERRFNEGGFRA